MICEHCRTQLEGCVEKNLLSRAQWDSICAYVISKPSREDADSSEAAKGFNPIMALYYGGALLILSAFGWFMGTQWEALGPSGILVVSLLYAALFGFVGRYLIGERFPVAGGLLITCAVGMTPLATWAGESLLGLWPGSNPGAYHGYYVWINESWIVIELATVAAALTALRKVKFSFLVMPAAIALWFLSMDIAQVFTSRADLGWELRSWVSIASGLAFLVGGRAVEFKSEGVDYAFWIYLAGLLAFWGGLTSVPKPGELGRLLYCAINLGLIGASLYLNRRTFAVFGATGVYGYLGHLAYSVFADSPLFPVALAFFGMMIILSTVLFQKNYKRMQGWVRPAYP